MMPARVYESALCLLWTIAALVFMEPWIVFLRYMDRGELEWPHVWSIAIDWWGEIWGGA